MVETGKQVVCIIAHDGHHSIVQRYMRSDFNRWTPLIQRNFFRGVSILFCAMKCAIVHIIDRTFFIPMEKSTFPNMYQTDFLEILWLLKREKVRSNYMEKALQLLKSTMQPDSIWKIKRPIKDLIIPIGNSNYGKELMNGRARDMMDFYTDAHTARRQKGPPRQESPRQGDRS